MEKHIDINRERGAATPSEAVRNTRRALQYLHGLLFFTFGVITLAAGLVVHYYPDSSSRWAVVLLLPMAWLVLRSIKRRRRDHDLWAMENRDSLSSFPISWPPESVFLRITWQVIGGSTIALGIAFAIQCIGLEGLPQSLYFIMVAVGGLHLALYGAWLAIDLGLAEHLLVICWYSAGASYILTTQTQIGTSVVFGGGLMLMGALLHLRWIRFAGPSEKSILLSEVSNEPRCPSSA